MKKGKKIRDKMICILGGIYVAWSVLACVQPVYAKEAAADDGAAGTTVSDTRQLSDPSIVIDGDLSEWRAMESIAVADGSVAEWKLAKSADGSMLYFCFGGTAKTEWDTTYLWDILNITYGNGTSLNCQIANIKYAWVLPGAEMAYKSNASGNNPGKYGVECMLPVNQDSYSITFAGTTVNDEDIPLFTSAEEVEAVYSGIEIDGHYSDWDAVTKTSAECASEQHDYECLDSVACVFDGDYVYIYLKDGEDGSAAGAGTASNGRYAIVTDMGRQLVFQIDAAKGGSVRGVAGAQTAYFGDEWEIAIPADALPLWKESISFGLYQSEPFVSGVMNLRGDEGYTGTAGEFTNIVYDGLYGDWNAYPHTLIQYATAGTGIHHPDGEGALYADGSELYGHVVTKMDPHVVSERGGEFTSAVSICFNGQKDYNADKTWNLYPRMVAVAQDGTIDWNPQIKDLPDGTYEFYIADSRGEYNTSALKNVSDLADYEKFFGKMMITVGSTKDETEFYIDLEQVALFLSHYSNTTVEASDFKMIEAQFGRIGNEFLSTAGTSSGPYMGVIIAMGVSLVVLLKKRRHVEVVL